jgi:predicted ATPase
MRRRSCSLTGPPRCCRGSPWTLATPAAVAGICRALDGIPLALELAAVRLRSLSPGQILSRLDSRFQLLSPGSAADLPQRRTLQGTLEWSYGLLTETERAMWRRVSVFAGSFDLDAAEAVCTGDAITPGEVADLVDGLVAKSVLSRAAGDGKARYRLLDTIGEFGLAKLRAEGSERKLRARHRDWYAAQAARPDAFGPRRAEWITALDTDHENIRAALEFCLSEPSELPAGAELACDLWRYWETHGHLTEGRRILAALLEKLDAAAEVRPRALWVAGYLAQLQDDTTDARRCWRQRWPPPARRAIPGRLRTRRASSPTFCTRLGRQTGDTRWRRLRCGCTSNPATRSGWRCR